LAGVLAPVGRRWRSGGSERVLVQYVESRECEPVVKLRVRSGESIQEAVRRFRKLCERSGLRKEMRRKAYYEKPSERRRREELKRLRKARQPARV
jgi:small subunit ribosomal protein S21